MMHRVYIGLGSNLDNPNEQLKSAIEHLSNVSSITDIKVSSFYHSKPVGPQDQPDFTNAVACFTTSLEPLELLDLLQTIEQQHNRVRSVHWGPRTLDLDILLYGTQTINIPRLTIPHPHMLERGFVIKPLSEIAPSLMLSNGTTVTQHLSKIDTSDLAIV